MSRSALESLFRRGTPLSPEAALPDDELLRRLRAGPDEGAYLEVVRRHGPMVWAACRNALACPADAEDAFQATFLALATAAGSVRGAASLPAWLHGVAVRVSAGARRQAARRRRREGRAAVPEAGSAVADSAWAEALRALQDEVERLPGPLRSAYVLCDLGGVRPPDAARHLGWKLGTLSGRLTQARQRLLERLARRGLAPAVAAGLVAGAGGAAGAVPRVLVESVGLYVGTNVAAGAAAGVAIHKLAVGGLVMGVTRTKLVALVVFAAGGVGVGVGPTLVPATVAQESRTVEPATTAQKTRPVEPSPANDAQKFPPGGGGLPGGGGGQPGGTVDPVQVTRPEPSGPSPRSVTLGLDPVQVTPPVRPASPPWEYKLADPKPRPELAAQLAAEAGGGWEFVAAVDGQLVFKRPAGAAALGLRGGKVGTVLLATPHGVWQAEEQMQRVVQAKQEEDLRRAKQAQLEAKLAADIAALQKQLDALRKGDGGAVPRR